MDNNQSNNFNNQYQNPNMYQQPVQNPNMYQQPVQNPNMYQQPEQYVNNSDSRQIHDAKKASGSLIGGYFGFGIVFYLIFEFIVNAITDSMTFTTQKDVIILTIIEIVKVILSVGATWFATTRWYFRKHTFRSDDLPQVYKRIYTVLAILCILAGINNYSKVKETIQNYENRISNYKYVISASQKRKSEEIVKQLYAYFYILQGSVFIIEFGTVTLFKKYITSQTVI